VVQEKIRGAHCSGLFLPCLLLSVVKYSSDLGFFSLGKRPEKSKNPEYFCRTGQPVPRPKTFTPNMTRHTLRGPQGSATAKGGWTLRAPSPSPPEDPKKNYGGMRTLPSERGRAPTVSGSRARCLHQCGGEASPQTPVFRAGEGSSSWPRHDGVCWWAK